ncbi:MAG: hypothetical protein HQK54_16430, partial [Oligoflexales bacterium]|nr:hypothetical protein [Oligoflexales bacterium]
LDISFFEKAFEHTRKFILNNFKIIRMEIGHKAFDAASGQIILKLKKNSCTPESRTEVIDITKNRSVLINQDEWDNADNEYKYKFHFDEDLPRILSVIKKAGFSKLSELYPHKNLRTCCMLLDMEDRFTSDRDHCNFNGNVRAFKYYEGAKSLKYKYSPLSSAKYFYYDKNLQDSINDELKIILAKKGIKNKKRIGLGDMQIYLSPKVYIRQSAKEIIASYDQGKSSANNSLYVFSLRNSSPESIRFLKFLVGYLNSTVASFYAQSEGIIRYLSGKQPQIKLSDLYDIIIPGDIDLQKEIWLISSQIIEGSIEKNFGILKIDHLLYEYIGINNFDRNYIISFYRQFIKS